MFKIFLTIKSLDKVDALHFVNASSQVTNYKCYLFLERFIEIFFVLAGGKSLFFYLKIKIL